MNKHYFFFLIVALSCNFSLTAQTTYHVKTAADGGDDANNGLAWNTAFATVQKALEAAESTTAIDQIWVAAGTYQPTLIPYDTHIGFAGLYPCKNPINPIIS